MESDSLWNTFEVICREALRQSGFGGISVRIVREDARIANVTITQCSTSIHRIQLVELSEIVAPAPNKGQLPSEHIASHVVRGIVKILNSPSGRGDFEASARKPGNQKSRFTFNLTINDESYVVPD